MNRPYSAAISVDVDSVAVHLRGYGVLDSHDTASVYEIAIPRILQLLEDCQAKATFFVVAQEAIGFSHILAEVIKRGHELASHSYTHPTIGQNSSWTELYEAEIGRSKGVLEDAFSTPIVGFRAPGWQARPDLLPLLSRAGYQYDSSVFPSWFLMLISLMMQKRLPSLKSGFWSSIVSSTAPTDHCYEQNHIWEFPVSCSPILRLPYYHTLRWKVPREVYRRVISGPTVAGAKSIQYVFHAIDFMTIEETDDTRIAHHPGMQHGLVSKLEYAQLALKELVSMRSVVRLKDLMPEEGA